MGENRHWAESHPYGPLAVVSEQEDRITDLEQRPETAEGRWNEAEARYVEQLERADRAVAKHGDLERERDQLRKALEWAASGCREGNEVSECTECSQTERCPIHQALSHTPDSGRLRKLERVVDAAAPVIEWYTEQDGGRRKVPHYLEPLRAALKDLEVDDEG